MRFAGFAIGFFVAAVAAGVILLAFADRSDAPDASDLFPGRTATPAPPTPTPLPRTWIERLDAARSGGTPQLVSCLDTNGDGRLNRADGSALTAPIDVPLVPGEACASPELRADWFEAPHFAIRCKGERPLLIIAILSAGSDLLAAAEGESLGMLDIVNALTRRAEDAGIPALVTISASAVFGAEMPQTSMERLIAGYAEGKLAASPCARAVLIGHSHGGIAVTSVTAALEDRFADRMLGVVIDRTDVLYDRRAGEMPARTALLNVFQTNEGWHGVRIDAPNVVNFDASAELAPIAPSDGGGGLALVSHKTLDDAPAVQTRIVDEVMRWVGLEAGR
jgi:putative intracellular protease/amidase